MKLRRILFLCFLVLCFAILFTESKLQQQAMLDDDVDDDDWDDDDDEDESYPLKPEVDDDGRIYKNPRNSPSANCPRNEKQAEIFGQKCLRKCSTDEDCKSKKKKCRCDGVCGMSCIKPERECPELEAFKYGTMIVSGRNFGDKAHYTCDPNYNLVGLSERICRAAGHWSGSSPSCKKDLTSFCSQPPKIKFARYNSSVEQTTFNLDSMVQYFCDDGYVTTGFQRSKCLMMDGTATWFGPDIVCEPRSCGSPMEISNGRRTGECYTFNCRITYHCAEGYELVGRTEKVCLADGTWFPKELPQCVQVASVECPPPEAPQNGKIFYTSLAYNSIVSYTCEYGYTRVGAATKRCGADRRWSGQTPICKEIDCGSPGTLYNGWIENIETGTGLGASIIFRCNDHMKLEGNSSSVCQIDGKWRHPLPQCLAPCVVPQIDNGHVIVASHDRDQISNATVVEHGERLLVECVQDYEFASNNTPVICNNGTWSIVPSCSPARCKQMPKPPKNGMVIAPKSNHGMKAVFKCKDGFELIGGGPLNNSFSIECSFGVWVGDNPHCIELYCPFPGYVENGKVLLVGNMGVYDYRPYVKKIVNNKQIMYDCDKGYYLSSGPPGATCVGGNWSPKELPKCSLGQHPRIRFNRRRRSITNTSTRNETVIMAYKKFIDFFQKISKQLLILEMNKSHDELRKKYFLLSDMKSNFTDYNKSKQHISHGNRSRSWDDKMINFLKVIYRKLQRIDSRHVGNETNVTMHELLNAMSRNFFHVDLSESRKINKNRESIEVKNQREFTKLKREFERIMRFYNKSMRWSEKQLRKSTKKQKQIRTGKGKFPKNKNKYKDANYYTGFYEFINGYINEKLSMLETNNTTEKLIKKTNMDKFSVQNGTTFTINEIYTFFKHIIEEKLNSSKVDPKMITVTLPTISEMHKKSMTLPKNNSVLDNEIPTAEIGLPKHRIRRIRNTDIETSPRKRRLLSLSYILSNMHKNSVTRENNQSKVEKFTLNELETQQQSRTKRFLSTSEINNQILLKNLYLNAYINEYNTNVKRSIPQNNQ